VDLSRALARARFEERARPAASASPDLASRRGVDGSHSNARERHVKIAR